MHQNCEVESYKVQTKRNRGMAAYCPHLQFATVPCTAAAT